MRVDQRTCDGCLTAVPEGEGRIYHLTMKAVCDDGPVVVPDEDVSEQLAQCLRELQDMPAVEAANDVESRFVFDLCYRCYRKWLSNPLGDL